MRVYHYSMLPWPILHVCLHMPAKKPKKKRDSVLMVGIVIWLVCTVLSTEQRSHRLWLWHICVTMLQSNFLWSSHYMRIGLFFAKPFIIAFWFFHMWIAINQRGINRYYQALRLILCIILLFVGHHSISYTPCCCVFPENIAEWIQQHVLFIILPESTGPYIRSTKV